MRRVNVSGCAILVEGDAAVLYQLWLATRDLKQPYKIHRLPKTGDGERYAIVY